MADALGAGGAWRVGVVGVSLSLVVAYALLSHRPELYVDGVRHFGFLVFLLSIGLHLLLLWTGLTAGEATVPEVVAVWLLAVALVVVAFRKTVSEQLRG